MYLGITRMIDQIIAFNKEFVAQKGYEKYLTDKYPDKKLAVLSPESVRKTVETIKTHPLVPKDIIVRGFIIDSETGELEEIN